MSSVLHSVVTPAAKVNIETICGKPHANTLGNYSDLLPILGRSQRVGLVVCQLSLRYGEDIQPCRFRALS